MAQNTCLFLPSSKTDLTRCSSHPLGLHILALSSNRSSSNAATSWSKGQSGAGVAHGLVVVAELIGAGDCHQAHDLH